MTAEEKHLMRRGYKRKKKRKQSKCRKWVILEAAYVRKGSNEARQSKGYGLSNLSGGFIKFLKEIETGRTPSLKEE